MKVAFLAVLTLPFLFSIPMSMTIQEQSRGIILGIDQFTEHVPAEGTAKFTGAVFAGEGLSDHRLKVKWIDPQGRVHDSILPFSADGTFEFSIKGVQVGIYRFDFSGMDGVHTVHREVIVADAAAVRDALDRKIKRAQEAADRIAHQARLRVQAAPVGANRDEAVRMLTNIEQQRGQVMAGVTHIEAVATACSQLASAPPDLREPALECLGDLASWADQTETEAAEMEAFEQRTRTEYGVCDSLETAKEGLKFVETATTLLTKPLDIIKKTIKEQLIPRAEAKNPPASEDIKFIVDRAKAEAKAAKDGLDGVIRSLPTLARETSVFIIDKLVKNYCSILEGPVTAELNVSVPEKGSLFYQYKLYLKAKIRMVADKSKVAGPSGIEYHGRIEGGASKVEFKENIFAAEPLPKGAKVILRKIVTPPVLKAADSDFVGSGQIARMASPGNFNVQYLGMLNESGMKLKQDRIVNDFSSLFKNRVGLIVLPQGGLIPKVTIFDFPIQKAAWVLDRCTKGAFELPKILDGNKLHLQKEFTRSETTANGIKVDWKVSYDAVGDK